MRLFTPEAMREADRKAVEMGYPSLLLMEWAGMKAARVYLDLFGKAPASSWRGRGTTAGTAWSWHGTSSWKGCGCGSTPPKAKGGMPFSPFRPSWPTGWR